MILNILIAGAGGFAGTVLRYLITLIPVKNPLFPYKTLVINILGSFLIALISVLAIKKAVNPRTILLLKTGFCGGFTTFSTFSLEAVNLFQSGHTAGGIIYILLSVILGFTAALAVFLLTK